MSVDSYHATPGWGEFSPGRPVCIDQSGNLFQDELIANNDDVQHMFAAMAAEIGAYYGSRDPVRLILAGCDQDGPIPDMPFLVAKIRHSLRETTTINYRIYPCDEVERGVVSRVVFEPVGMDPRLGLEVSDPVDLRALNKLFDSYVADRRRQGAPLN